MREYFRIRPRIGKYESLTSYIARVAKLNETTFNGIIRKVSLKNQYLQNSRYRYLDINPNRVINIELLSDLTCVAKEELLSQTLHPFELRISGESEMNLSDQFSRTGLWKFYDSTKRWFCPMCLKDHKIFKILWQFENITICEIHKCYLQKACNKCGNEQPYIGNQLMDGRCHTCNLSLSSDEKESLAEDLLTIENLTINQFWKSFVSLNEPITAVQFGLSIKQTISLKILYLQSDLLEEKSSARKPLTRRYKAYFKKMLLTGDSGKDSFLAAVIRFFIFSGISIDQFRDLRVPEKFFYSFIKSEHKEDMVHLKEASNCETPWCQYINNNDRMQHLGIYRTSRGDFYCSGCYIKYGYQKNTGKWIELKGDIKLIKKIIPYMHLNQARFKIFKEINDISSFRLNEIIGYMYVHELVPVNYESVYDKCSIPGVKELLDKFKVLIKQVGRSVKNLQIEARKIYGWKIAEFFLFYHQKEVQELVLNTPNKISNSPSHHKAIPRLLNNYILRSLDDYINACKMRNLCSLENKIIKLKISNCILFLHGIEQIILAKKENLLLKEEQVYVDLCWKGAKQYVNQQRNEKKLISTGEIFRVLVRSYHWIQSRCPELPLWIKEQVKASLNENKKMVLEKKKEKIEKAMKYLKEQDLDISKSAIVRVAGLKYYEITGKNELSDYYFELLRLG
ncbi:MULTISPECIES: TniQ family protein [Paenibacillus]|uniref:TniQ protein n=1 Tax=Paenibacillus pabuli TaxID=1472 RepID=A0A855XK95_9BACL|nr:MULTISPECIES: TniQ family protein [Paenibacillus]PWW32919.1 TniQ protein [Paenibacillus pabuli]PXV98802.1 TniQ protein [Paenibacillus taichungensis]